MDGVHLDSALIGSVIYSLIDALIDSLIVCRCGAKWKNGNAGRGAEMVKHQSRRGLKWYKC